MANLKEETLERLQDYKKSPDDIVWIGTRRFKIDKDKFWELADVEYDDGYGAQEVASDLLIVGTDWWLERFEYDGSEWWQLKSFPTEPEETKDVSYLIVGNSGLVGWVTLDELNAKEATDDYCSLY